MASANLTASSVPQRAGVTNSKTDLNQRPRANDRTLGGHECKRINCEATAVTCYGPQMESGTQEEQADSRRFAALRDLAVLDTPREREYDDIVAIASQVCGTPIALITLLDEQRQWFKAALGTELTETPLEIAFCDHAIRQPGTMVVEDMRNDPRFMANPLVTGDAGIRFYAGAPLRTADDIPLGTLCVLDTVPRRLSGAQRTTLEALARQVMGQLELRRLLAQKHIDEARHRLIIESAVEYGILTTDMAGIIDSWNEGAVRMFGWTAREACGQPCAILFTDDDVDSGVPEAEMAKALHENRLFDERWHPRADGSLFWGRCEVMPLRSAVGQPQGFLKIMQDRTVQRVAEKNLRDSETRVRLALDAAELGAWEAIPGSNEVFGDARARELLGYDNDAPISFEAFLERVHVDDRDRFAAAVSEALVAGKLDVEFRLSPDLSDQLRWLRSRAQASKASGERHRLIGTVRDVSAEKAAEVHRQLLNNELQHRVKNTLGVVQGIVTQSLRAVATPAAARDAITSRLSTLAHAHDILTQSSWKAAPIGSVVEGAVLAHCAETSRVKVLGPPIYLKARAALALSMALHELFTNAVKYGALSNEVGFIDLSWSIGEGEGDSRRFEVAWQECEGPIVAEPTRTGFGSRLTGASLAGDLGGAGVIKYAPDGVRWTLTSTLGAVVEEAVSF